MFERWAADLIASTLGRYLDVQKDKLQISLWSGQGVLENVELRPNAFEHLQLPICVRSGRIGRLRLQIPWGSWMVQGALLTIELSDVELTATPRDDVDWEDGPATAREQAAKQAELAAAEFATISKRSGWGLNHVVDRLVSFLLNSLRLSISNLHIQLVNHGPDPCLRQEDSTIPCTLGLRIDQIHTALDNRVGLTATVYRLLRTATQGAHVQREIHVQGCQLYLTVPNSEHSNKTPALLSDAQKQESAVSVLDTVETETARHGLLQHDDQEGIKNSKLQVADSYLVRPFHLALRVAAHKGHEASTATGLQSSSTDAGNEAGLGLDVLVSSEGIHLQAAPKQLQALLLLSNQAQIWNKRARYGKYRLKGWSGATPLHGKPRALLSSSFSAYNQENHSGGDVVTAWQSSLRRASGSMQQIDEKHDEVAGGSGARTSDRCTWADMWRYAVRSVLHDLKQDWLQNGAPAAIAKMQQRRLALLQLRYVQLYRRRALCMHAVNAKQPPDDCSDADSDTASVTSTISARTAVQDGYNDDGVSDDYTGVPPSIHDEQAEVPTTPRSTGRVSAGSVSSTISHSPHTPLHVAEDAVGPETLRQITLRLEELESQLDVVHILQFRAVAEQIMRGLQQDPAGSAAPRGAWGIPNISSVLSFFTGQKRGSRARLDMERNSIQHLQQLLHRSTSEQPLISTQTTPLTQSSSQGRLAAASSPAIRPRRSLDARARNMANNEQPTGAASANPALRLSLGAVLGHISCSLIDNDNSHPSASVQLYSTSLQVAITGNNMEGKVGVDNVEVWEHDATGSPMNAILDWPGRASHAVTASETTPSITNTLPDLASLHPRRSVSQYQPMGLPRSSSDHFSAFHRSSFSSPFPNIPHQKPAQRTEDDVGLSWHAGGELGDSDSPARSPKVAAGPRTSLWSRALHKTPSMDVASAPSVPKDANSLSDHAPVIRVVYKSQQPMVPAADADSKDHTLPNISVNVAPLLATVTPAFIDKLSTELSAGITVNSSLDVYIQQAICGLPTYEAQTLAKAQYLQNKPPSLQMQLEVAEATLVLQGSNKSDEQLATGGFKSQPSSSVNLPQSSSSVSITLNHISVSTLSAQTTCKSVKPATSAISIAQSADTKDADSQMSPYAALVASLSPRKQTVDEVAPLEPAIERTGRLPRASADGVILKKTGFRTPPARYSVDGHQLTKSVRFQDQVANVQQQRAAMPEGETSASDAQPQPSSIRQGISNIERGDQMHSNSDDGANDLVAYLQDNVLYQRLSVDVGGIMVQYYCNPDSCQMQSDKPRNARPTTPNRQHVLLSGLGLHSKLSTNRIPQDTTLPNLKGEVELLSLQDVTIQSSHIHGLAQALTDIYKQQQGAGQVESAAGPEPAANHLGEVASDSGGAGLATEPYLKVSLLIAGTGSNPDAVQEVQVVLHVAEPQPTTTHYAGQADAQTTGQLGSGNLTAAAVHSTDNQQESNALLQTAAANTLAAGISSAPKAAFTFDVSCKLPSTSLSYVEDANQQPDMQASQVTLQLSGGTVDVSSRSEGLTVDARLADVQLLSHHASYAEACDVCDTGMEYLQPWIQIAKHLTASKVLVTWKTHTGPDTDAQQHSEDADERVARALSKQSQTHLSVSLVGFQGRGYHDQDSCFVVASSGNTDDPDACFGLTWDSAIVSTPLQNGILQQQQQNIHYQHVLFNRWGVAVNGLTLGLGIAPAVLAAFARMPTATSSTPTADAGDMHVDAPVEFQVLLQNLAVAAVNSNNMVTQTCMSCDALLTLERLQLTFPFTETVSPNMPLDPLKANGAKQCDSRHSDTSTDLLLLRQLFFCVSNGVASTQLLPMLHIPSITLTSSSSSSSSSSSDMDVVDYTNQCPIPHHPESQAADADHLELTIPLVFAAACRQQAPVLAKLISMVTPTNQQQTQPQPATMQPTNQETSATARPVPKPMELKGRIGKVCGLWGAQSPLEKQTVVSQLLVAKLDLELQIGNDEAHDEPVEPLQDASAAQSTQQNTMLQHSNRMRVALRWDEVSTSLAKIQTHVASLKAEDGTDRFGPKPSTVDAGVDGVELPAALPALYSPNLAPLRLLASHPDKTPFQNRQSSTGLSLHEQQALNAQAYAPPTEALLSPRMLGEDFLEGHETLLRYFSNAVPHAAPIDAATIGHAWQEGDGETDNVAPRLASSPKLQPSRHSTLHLPTSPNLDSFVNMASMNDSLRTSQSTGPTRRSDRQQQAGKPSAVANQALGVSPSGHTSVMSFMSPSLLGRSLEPKGDTLYCNFRAAGAGGGLLAGMQDVARLPATEARSHKSEEDLDELNFYSVSEGSSMSDEIFAQDEPGSPAEGETVTAGATQRLASQQQGTSGCPAAGMQFITKLPLSRQPSGRRGDIKQPLVLLQAARKRLTDGLERISIIPTALLLHIGHLGLKETGCAVGKQGAASDTHWQAAQQASVCTVLIDIQHHTTDSLQSPAVVESSSALPEVHVKLGTIPALASLSLWDCATWGIQSFVTGLSSTVQQPARQPTAHSETARPTCQNLENNHDISTPTTAIPLPVSSITVALSDLQVQLLIAPPQLASSNSNDHAGVEAAAATETELVVAAVDVHDLQAEVNDTADTESNAPEDDTDAEPQTQQYSIESTQQHTVHTIHAHSGGHTQQSWCTSPCLSIRSSLGLKVASQEGILSFANVDIPVLSISAGSIAQQYNSSAKASCVLPLQQGADALESLQPAVDGVWSVAVQSELFAHLGGVESFCSLDPLVDVQFATQDLSMYVRASNLLAVTAFATAAETAMSDMQQRMAACSAETPPQHTFAGTKQTDLSLRREDLQTPEEYQTSNNFLRSLRRPGQAATTGHASQGMRMLHLSRKSAGNHVKGGSDDGSVTVIGGSIQPPRPLVAETDTNVVADDMVFNPAGLPTNPLLALPPGMYQARLAKLAVLISEHTSTSFTPCLEAAVTQVSLQIAKGTDKSQQTYSGTDTQHAHNHSHRKGAEDAMPVHRNMAVVLDMKLIATLQLNAYNTEKMGWEPSIDPWTMQVEYELQQLLGSQHGSTAQSWKPCHSISFSSPHLLQCTLSPATMAAVGRAQSLLKSCQLRVPQSSSNTASTNMQGRACNRTATPDGYELPMAALPTHIASSNNLQPRPALANVSYQPQHAPVPVGNASLWVCNDLGCPIELWITRKKSGHAPFMMSPTAAWHPENGELQFLGPGSRCAALTSNNSTQLLEGRLAVAVIDVQQRHHLTVKHLLANMLPTPSQHEVATNRHADSVLAAAADGPGAAPSCSPQAQSNTAQQPTPVGARIDTASCSAMQAAFAAATALYGNAPMQPPTAQPRYCPDASKQPPTPSSITPSTAFFRLAATNSWQGVFGPLDFHSGRPASFSLSMALTGPAHTLARAASFHGCSNVQHGSLHQGQTGNARSAAALPSALPIPSHLLRIVCDVLPSQQGGRSLSLHTNVQITNRLSLLVCIGYINPLTSGSAAKPAVPVRASSAHFQTSETMQHDVPSTSYTAAKHASNGPAQPNVTVMLAPGQKQWLPAPALIAQLTAGLIFLQVLPRNQQARAQQQDRWGDPVDLKSFLLEFAEQTMLSSDGASAADDWNEAGIVSKHITCRMWSAAGHRDAPSHQFVHALLTLLRSKDGKYWELNLEPALVINNQLPVPMHTAIQPARGQARELRQPVAPHTSAAVLLNDPKQLQHILIKPSGFTWSSLIEVNPTYSSPNASNNASLLDLRSEDSDDEKIGLVPALQRFKAQQVVPGVQHRTSHTHVIAEHTFVATAPGQGIAPVRLRLRAVRKPSGQLVISIVSPLWLYNCTGLPVAIRIDPACLQTRDVKTSSPSFSTAGLNPSTGLSVAAAVAAESQQKGGIPTLPIPEMWVAPCVGPNGETLAIAAPRTTYNAATQAMNAAIASNRNSETTAVRMSTAGNSSKARDTSQAGARSQEYQEDTIERTPSKVGPARGLSALTAASATVAGTGLQDASISPSAASQPSISAASRRRAGAENEWHMRGQASSSASYARPTVHDDSIGTRGPSIVAPSQSSLRTVTSHSSLSVTGNSTNPFWQPAMLPTLCGDIDPTTMPLQLRLMPQGGSGTANSMAQDFGLEGAGPGQSWSRSIRLLHAGSTEVVALPCPLPKEDAASGGVRDMQAGGYFVCVRLVRVQGTKGCWALHVLPRFVLYNTLPMPLQLQQPGSGRVRTLLNVEDRWSPLGPGMRRPIHWPDASAPLRLSLRVSEPGWSWSGSMDVGSGVPGDLFVKVRHRNLQETLLVHVDVRPDASGILLISLSHQPTAFSPYRVDNFTCQALHVQQARCPAEDIIRPYSCLPYAWDEPSLPHKLSVSLPGGQRLGSFHLDMVGSSRVVALHGAQSSSKQSQQYLVAVVANGPTRVLQITDLAVHERTAYQAAPKNKAEKETGAMAWLESAKHLTHDLAKRVAEQRHIPNHFSTSRRTTFWHSSVAPMEVLPEEVLTVDSSHGHQLVHSDGAVAEAGAEAALTKGPVISTEQQHLGTTSEITAVQVQQHNNLPAQTINASMTHPALPVGEMGQTTSRSWRLQFVDQLFEVPSGTLHLISSGAGSVNRRLLQTWQSMKHRQLDTEQHNNPLIVGPQHVQRLTQEEHAAHNGQHERTEAARHQQTQARHASDMQQARLLQLKPAVQGPGSTPLVATFAVALPGVGVSLVSDNQEISYLQLGAVQLGVMVNTVQAAIHASFGQLRIDNCLLDASHPTALISPVTYSLFGTPQPVLPANCAWARDALYQGLLWSDDASNSQSNTNPIDATTAAQGSMQAINTRNQGVGMQLNHIQSRRIARQTPSPTGMTEQTVEGVKSGAMQPMPPPKLVQGGKAGKAASAGAITLEGCVWLRRPGGVLCVQHLGLRMGPTELSLEEAHLRSLATYATTIQQVYEQASVTLSNSNEGTPQLSTVCDAFDGPSTSFGMACQTAGTLSLSVVTPPTQTNTAPAMSRQYLPAAETIVKSIPDGNRLPVVSALDISASAQALTQVPRMPTPHAAWEPHIQILADISKQGKAQRLKLYIDELSISRLRLALSFLPAPWRVADKVVSKQRKQARSVSMDALQHHAGVEDLNTTTGAGHNEAVSSLDKAQHSVSLPSAGLPGQTGMSSTGNNVVRLLLSLAHLEGAWLTLKPLKLRHPLVGPDGLVQLLGRHYMPAALLQVAVAVGSLDIFGDLTRLIQAWGVGVWLLLSMPAQGAMKGGFGHAVHGFVRAVLGLMRNTTLATFNTVLKYVRRTHIALLALCPIEVSAALAAAAQPLPLPNLRQSRVPNTTDNSAQSSSTGHVTGQGNSSDTALEQQHVAVVRQAAAAAAAKLKGGAGQQSKHGNVRPEWTLSAIDAPHPGPLRALPAGYGALLSNFNRELASLNLGGILRQAPAVALLPCVVVLRMAETVIASVQEALLRNSKPRCMRVPRFVDPNEPLQPYNWLESYCRLLQQHLAGGLFSSEDFIGCVALAGTRLGILTSRHLLCVAPQHAHEVADAELLLVISINDVVFVQAQGREVVLGLFSYPGSLLERRICASGLLQHVAGAVMPHSVAIALSAASQPGGVDLKTIESGTEHDNYHVTSNPEGSMPNIEHNHYVGAQSRRMPAILQHPILQHPRRHPTHPAASSGIARCIRLVSEHGKQNLARKSVTLTKGETQPSSSLKAVDTSEISLAIPQSQVVMLKPEAQHDKFSNHTNRHPAALGGSSVNNWFSVIRVTALDEQAAKGMAGLLHAAVCRQEEQRWAGCCSTIGFNSLP